MVDDAHLIKYGFKSPGGKADNEVSEEFRGSTIKTGYPTPSGRYRLHYEGYNISIEEPYYWILHYLRYFSGFSRIDKITDVFSASENSAFFGAAQQKMGIQQDKVSQFLATIGKMVRELFQLVREMRILDERISYYSDSYTNSPSSESAEITLKGIWVDLVEQGAKNPASVYGMAREVQFTTLPDLFFSTHPSRQEDVDLVVEKERGQFNRKIREVLKRKLRSFLAWKDHSYDEIKNRRVFTLKYLRQHFEIIRMYMTWVKPYLKNIQRMQLDQSRPDSPDLLVAFESSMMEVEILAIKKHKKYSQCLLMSYLFRTRPEMNYNQEYNRGPIHLGRVEMNFRAYAWTDEQIENYKKMRDHEDIQLLGVIDGSVKAAMESLGDELMRYLKEAGEEIADKKEEPKKDAKRRSGAFLSVFEGFAELFTSFKVNKEVKKTYKKKSSTQILHEALEKEKVQDTIKKSTFTIYDHFKKQHGMLSFT
jgi:hypothetical protein